ncbi:hypothetical protein ES703_120563 [subsurface metagenome]
MPSVVLMPESVPLLLSVSENTFEFDVAGPSAPKSIETESAEPELCAKPIAPSTFCASGTSGSDPLW